MKPYIKPELFYERYEVSQHIADCAWEWENSTDPNNCMALPDQGKLPGFPVLFPTEKSSMSFVKRCCPTNRKKRQWQ